MFQKGAIFGLLLCLFLSAHAQNRWSKVYYQESDAIGTAISDSYDPGILVAGKHGHNSSNYAWLVKTDVNGDLLWEKTIGDPSSNIKISDISQNQYGDLFIAGLTGYYNNIYYDPLVMKFNSCGEKEWCKVFYTDWNNSAKHIVSTRDGGCVAVITYMKEDLQDDRICLAKFSSEGSLLWEYCYNSPDTSLNNEEPYDLIITPDLGFLISGRCYYQNPLNPNQYWPKAYFIKVDSSGMFEWETIVNKEVVDVGGHGWNSVLNMDSIYYYSSISQYYYSSNYEAAALLKMNLYGEIVGIYELAEPSDYGKIVELLLISDSTFAASAVWGNQWVALPPKAVIIDTLGTIIYQRELIDNEMMSYTCKTFDNKLMFLTNKYEESSNWYDTYLVKLNEELIDDTIYSISFLYDTLCPTAILSDTIVQNACDVIVGIDERKDKFANHKQSMFSLYPNPATSFVNIQTHNDNDVKTFHFTVYDMFGRKQEEIQIPKGQKEIQIGVSDYPQGIYVAVLRSERKMLDRKKFIVNHQAAY
ncbi:MAG: hypothetical protein DRI83_06350 [Bacteroidetes bacterium]|nr:MAG: hypothetical protein DRI83_06350 [Bacteroidota bacterium]